MRTLLLNSIFLFCLMTVKAQDCTIVGIWNRTDESKNSITLIFSKDGACNWLMNGEGPLTRAEQLATKDAGLTEDDYVKIEDTLYYKVSDSKLPRKEGTFYSKNELKGSRFYFTFIDCNKILMETGGGSKAEFTRSN